MGEPVYDLLFYLKTLPELIGLVTLLGIILFFACKRFDRMDFVLVFWILLFLVYMTYVPHKEARYAIPLLAPLILMSSRGYSRLISKTRKGKVALLVFLIFFSWTVYPPFSDFTPMWVYSNRSYFESIVVADFIGKEMPPEYVIYCNFDFPVLAYYSGREIVVLYDHDKSFYDNFPDNMKSPGWFVHYQKIDRHPDDDFLASDGAFEQIKEFNDVTVYEYTP